MAENDNINGVAHYIEKFYRTQLNLNTEQKLDIEKAIESINGKIIFRGQANAEWKIVSGAGRRLNIENKNKQDDFIRYHVNLIANARTHGYGNIETNTILNDLELLAEIQHSGGATCLIDFTTNVLIALWMATGSEKQDKYNKKNDSSIEIPTIEKDGKLFWIDLGEKNNYSNIEYYNNNNNKPKEENTIQKLLSNTKWNFETRPNKLEPCYWFWEPTKINNRITSQDSVFLFGLSKFPLKANDNDSRIVFKEMFIEGKDKRRVRQELELFFGISAESIYSDVAGFSLHGNNQHLPVSEKILSKNSCFQNAKECLKKDQNSLAVSYFDEAISCKRENKKCKRIGKCNCDIQLGELFFWKAFTHYNRKETEEAILNYQYTISFYDKLSNSDCSKLDFKYDHKLYCESFRRIVGIYYDKHEYNAAKCVAFLFAQIYWKNAPNMAENVRYNGADAVFALLELSIMTFNKEEFIQRLDNAQKIVYEFENNNCLNEETRLFDSVNNSKVLFTVLKELGMLIFNLQEKDIQCKIITVISEIEDISRIITEHIKSKMEHDQKIRLIGYFYWNYFDLKYWLETFVKNMSKINDEEKESYRQFVIDNSQKLILIIQKGHESQSRLKNKVFAESRSNSDIEN